MIDDEHLLHVATSETHARDLALVLASAGIVHRVERQGPSWRLVVPLGDAERAAAVLSAYDDERERRPARTPVGDEYGRTYAGVVVAGLLVVCYAVTGPAIPATRWSRAGAASAAEIVHG